MLYTEVIKGERQVKKQDLENFNVNQFENFKLKYIIISIRCYFIIFIGQK
jgi:hypothetical protein